MDTRKRFGAGLVLVGLLVGMLPLVASANHPVTTDAGYDVAQNLPDSNQESYWEAFLENIYPGSTAECTKYENHSGFIPAQYDAAIIKDGSSLVRVYDDLFNVGSFTALGAANPNAQHPNKRFDAPHSWVMKCTIELPQETTTTTEQETTTTTEQETTTTTEEETTTTTEQETTTTTEEDTTTTVVQGEPRFACVDSVIVTLNPGDDGYEDASLVLEDVTCAPTLVKTQSPSPEELPFTGDNSAFLLALAGGLILSGVTMIGATAIRKETE